MSCVSDRELPSTQADIYILDKAVSLFVSQSIRTIVNVTHSLSQHSDKCAGLDVQEHCTLHNRAELWHGLILQFYHEPCVCRLIHWMCGSVSRVTLGQVGKMQARITRDLGAHLELEPSPIKPAFPLARRDVQAKEVPKGQETFHWTRG